MTLIHIHLFKVEILMQTDKNEMNVHTEVIRSARRQKEKINQFD